MSGYIHGNNNSSFDLDNRFNTIVSLLERMLAAQQELLSELRVVTRQVEKIADSNDVSLDRWEQPPKF